MRQPGSFQPWYQNVVNLGSDETGRGADVWDDSVMTHEMHHWIFDKSVHPFPPFKLKGGDHGRSRIMNGSTAIVEGYAEYGQMFRGGEYGSSDRLRGYHQASDVTNLIEIDEHDAAGKYLRSHYHVGGAYALPTPSGTPAFDTPNRCLHVEGYFAVAVYQIHHALIEGGILFADAPTYWHGYNSFVTTAQSDRFSRILRLALRNFPNNPTRAQRLSGSEQYLKQVLAAAGDVSAEFQRIVQAILELNNLLNPVVGVTTGTSSSTPGTTIAGPITLGETDVHNFIVQITDTNGNPLAGHNVHFDVTTVADYSFSGAAPAFVRGRVPGAGHNRATNANGIVNISFEAPPGSAGRVEAMKVSYQADFDTDPTFDPPQRGDDLDSTLRQLYLYELRAASKVWGGVDNNFGARVEDTITINVQA